VHQIQEWLGHATVATTLLYVDLGQDEARKVMEATSL
jgi:site-specific recombinase XerD